MKILTLPILLIGLLSTLFSCDKISYPTKIVTELDTTLYTDGIWAVYPQPKFEGNANTTRNILLEDYTGHKCPNCPNAASAASALENDNPGRVFVASIHTGPGGDGAFQDISIDCSDPENDFCYDFRTTESNTYGQNFSTGLCLSLTLLAKLVIH